MMYTAHLRLGYQGPNRYLRSQGVLTDRTARLSTVAERGIEYLEELYEKNLQDLLTILRWNVENGILFYRASSSLAPHVTNGKLLSRVEDEGGKPAYRRLAYGLNTLALRRVGRFVREQGIRLTFHPEAYLVLGTENPETLTNSCRELYYHYKLCKYMRLGAESVVVLHGGGVYGNKLESMGRWTRNYLALPAKVRDRVVLENDERNYSIAEVLEMSETVRAECGRAVPVVLDVFHFACTDEYRRRRGEVEQPDLEGFLPAVLATWPAAVRPKMHLSEQRPRGPLGAHSDYVSHLPAFLRGFYRRFHRDLDVMIEAKQGEQAVLHLLGRPSPVDFVPAWRDLSREGEAAPAPARRHRGGDGEEAEEETVLVLGTCRRTLQPFIATRKARGAEDTARVVVAEGAECQRALGLLRRSPGEAPRGIVLVNPTTHEPCPDNVIVHGNLPLGAERNYRHVLASVEPEEIAKSAARFLR